MPGNVLQPCNNHIYRQSLPDLRTFPLSRARSSFLPLLASNGLVPDRAAAAASLRPCPTWENDPMTWAAVTAPMRRRSVKPRVISSTMVCN